MGAELVTVSTDTEFVHLAWKRDEKELADVTYKMGADPTGAVFSVIKLTAKHTGQ